jgi:hypothetical protein
VSFGREILYNFIEKKERKTQKKTKIKKEKSIFILLRGEVRAGGERTAEKEWETVTVLL